MARLFISAAHKSSGKTTVSLGLCAALRALGLDVQPFKKGPDFIDPLWLSAAAGRPCRNLDRHTMTEPEILAFYTKHAASADISIIEGNKGLYDGVATDGRDSGAALARLLKAPVVLVVDSQGMTRGIAPLLIGYRSFDPAITIAGVILNKVSGPRHEAKLRSAVETYTDVPVLGAIHRSPTLEITERRLGLIPANETPEASVRIASIAAAVSAQIDLDRLLAIARTAPPLRCPPLAARPARPGPRRRVGIARDAAFGFYYTEDMESLAAAGFDPVSFDTLKDRHLPPGVDGLFLGGGFPETHMEALEARRAAPRDSRRGSGRSASLRRMWRHDVPVAQHYLAGPVLRHGWRSRGGCGHARTAAGQGLCPVAGNRTFAMAVIRWRRDADRRPRVPLCCHREPRSRNPLRLSGSARARHHRQPRRHRDCQYGSLLQPSARRRR
jgi:cobyrinic acid a,c-diamide synthase